MIQQARRDAGLNITDRIQVVVEASPEVTEAVRAHREFVAREVLAEQMEFGPVGADAFAGEAGDAEPVRVTVARV